MKRGIVICGHGSRNESSVRVFLNVVDEMRRLYPHHILTYGFIEYSDPILEKAIRMQIAQGVGHVIVVPGILFTGVHMRVDIPVIIRNLQDEFPHVSIQLASHLGISTPLVELATRNILEADSLAGGLVKDKTALLVIGVGSSVEQANVDVAAVTRILWEHTGFAWANYAFISKMTFPTIEKGFEQLFRTGFESIIVLPFLLFPGVYLENIILKIEKQRALYMGKIYIANSLEMPDVLANAMQVRLREVQEGLIDLAKDISDELKSRLHKK